MAPARTPLQQIPHASRRDNGASKPVSPYKSIVAAAKRPAPPVVPPRPYVAPPLPLSERRMQSEYEKVLNGPVDGRDASFGESLAQLLGGPLSSGNRPYHLRVAAVQNFLSGQRLHRQPMFTDDFPVRYKLGNYTQDENRIPAVFLKNTNAPFIERTMIANHGFAYMTSEVCDAVRECGQFHLFVYRQSPSDPEPQYPLRYCGLFLAHKTPYQLSPRGWECLSDEAKEAAAQITCVSRRGGGRSSATPEAILHYRQQLNAGAVGMPLVLLQCVKFSYNYGSNLLSADSMLSVAVKRTPVKAIPGRAELERREAEEAEVKAAIKQARADDQARQAAVRHQRRG
ncbi:hypothetical protein TRAPUB_10414 [Trametes pubescens]|uniref:Uncharacterized protein n=1 Tax=Trametes pubescens TaxID=154538 RepID=A0A1M2VZH7_TRAPU|nr:hypothetical protein TRAPUB_10414 [Trametes pubescens]